MKHSILFICLFCAALKCAADTFEIPPFSEPFAVRIAVTKPEAQLRGSFFPLPLRQPMPEYPLIMRQAKVAGEVLVSFTVEADGRVTGLKIAKESFQKVFDEAAISAVKKWRFMPAMKGRSVAPIMLEYSIRFELPPE